MLIYYMYIIQTCCPMYYHVHFSSIIYWMVVRKNYQLSIYPPLTVNKTSISRLRRKTKEYSGDERKPHLVEDSL